MSSTRMWTMLIRSAIIRGKATSCCGREPARQASMTARCSAVNDWAGSCNTTNARPHDYVDHTPYCYVALERLDEPSRPARPQGTSASVGRPGPDAIAE